MADEYLTDGQSDFLGGQDASKVPSRIPPNACASAVNTSFTRGVPGPRWGTAKRRITFDDGTLKSPEGFKVPYEEIFYGGRFQSFIPYQIGLENFIVIVVSGIIFLVSVDTFHATVMQVEGEGLNENTPRHNWSTAGKFTVIFDFPNYPIILDGNTARRADPAKAEVPISVLGAFNQNRLFIANAGNEFTGGDPAGSLITPEAPVTFIETETLASPYFGQIFQLPTGIADGPITAMTFLQNVDTSTGIGPLIVATGTSIFSFQSQLPRSAWENGQFGSSFVATAGVVGPRAIINVNSDLFFLSSDYQVRSASMSRDEQKKWSHVPISREVEDWLYTNDTALSSFAVMGYFQNKVVISTNPYRVEAFNTSRQPVLDVAHGGFVVLELDNQATLGKDNPPAWGGLWAPFRPMDFATTNLGQRFFAISKDEGSRNELYEVLPEQTYDTDSDGTVRQVTSIIETRELDCKNSFDNKALHSIDLSFRRIQGDFKAAMLFKPAQGIDYALWGTLDNVAPWRTCCVPDDCFVNGFAPHELRDQTLGYPTQNSVCDPVGKTTYSIGKQVQLKFVIEGVYWELEEYRFKAKAIPQSQQINTCKSYSDVAVCQPCSTFNPWEIRPFKGCFSSDLNASCNVSSDSSTSCGSCS